MDDRNTDLISELKELREQIGLLNNIFTSIKRYEKVAVKASKQIDSILYELTGDKFYITKIKLGGKR